MTPRILKASLITSIILLGLGVGIAVAGVLISSGYTLAICQIEDSRVVFVPDDNEYSGHIHLEYNTSILNLAEWIDIYSQSNSSLVRAYIDKNYPIGSNLPCYVSDTNIVLFVNIGYSTGITGMIFIILSMLTVLVYGIMKCCLWRKRYGYRDLDTELHRSVDAEIIVPGSDNNNENTNLNKYAGALESFEEAQLLLWQYKQRIKENVFNKLRYKQVEAITGNEASKKKFQQLVYNTISSLDSRRLEGH